MTNTDSQIPPAKFVYGDDFRMGHAIDLFVSNGVIISGTRYVHSILPLGVWLSSWSHVPNSVLMSGMVLACRARVDRAILDKNVYVGEGTTIEVGLGADRRCGFIVGDGGITMVPKGTRVEN